MSKILAQAYWCLCKVPLILVRFEWNLTFLDQFSKNLHIKFHESTSNGSWFFFLRTDRHTYTTMPTVASRNSSKALKNKIPLIAEATRFSFQFSSNSSSFDLNLLFPGGTPSLNKHCSSLGQPPWSKLTYQILGFMLCTPPRPNQRLRPNQLSPLAYFSSISPPLGAARV